MQRLGQNDSREGGDGDVEQPVGQADHCARAKETPAPGFALAARIGEGGGSLGGDGSQWKLKFFDVVRDPIQGIAQTREIDPKQELVDQQYDNRNEPLSAEKGSANKAVGACGRNDPLRDFIRQAKGFGLRRLDQELPPDGFGKGPSAQGQASGAHDNAGRNHAAGHKVNQQHLLALELNERAFGDLDEQDNSDPLSRPAQRHAHHQAEVDGGRQHDEPDKHGGQHRPPGEAVLKRLKVRLRFDLQALYVVAVLLAHRVTPPCRQMPVVLQPCTRLFPLRRWCAKGGTVFASGPGSPCSSVPTCYPGR